MNGSRIRPVIIKEFRQIRRDRRTLGVLVLVPAFLLIMYGYALNLDVQHMPTGVYDADRTPASRAFIERFFTSETSEFFYRSHTVTHPSEIETLLMSGEAALVLVVPAGFSETRRRGERPQVQVLVDGVMSSTASTAIGYVEGVFRQETIEILQRQYGRNASLPVVFEPRVWYNPEMRSALFLIPGLIAFILMIITVVATSLSIVRERELGSMEQLMVSPLTPGEMILGKLTPYALISMAATVLVLAAGGLLFDMPMRGSYALLALATFIYLLGALGLGLVVSTMVKSQEVAFLLASLITLLPTFILSGFVFPISNMPVVIQAVTYVVPARYFLTMLRGIMLKGVGLEAFGRELFLLTVFAGAMLGIGALRLKKILG